MTPANIKVSSLLLLVCLCCYFRASPEEQILKFAIGQIRLRYVHEVNTAELVGGALEGCVARLDRYCQYYDRESVAQLNEEIDRQFAGIGVEIQIDPETKELVVTSPLPDSPAYKAGIRAGDCIIAVEGQEVQGMAIEQVSRLMRGKPGSTVRLRIRPFGTSELRELAVTRQMIKVSTLLGDRRRPDGSWEYLLEHPERPKLGYVRIASFAPDTAQELDSLIGRLLGEGIEGLILDLRNDPGGLLGPAVAICDLFVSSGTIVTTRGRGGVIRSIFPASGNAKYPNLPLVVVVNQETASAAEIVAACLQDYGRAVVVGQRTFGKGTVQELISLGSRYGVLKVTTATYWRPSNRDINRPPGAGEDLPWGVQPDAGFEVKVEGEALARLNRARALRDLANPQLALRWRAALARSGEGSVKEEMLPAGDPQLAKAVEYLTKLLNEGDNMAEGSQLPLARNN